jgi:RNA polymerase sigma-70 factor (ECF subfamily)
MTDPIIYNEKELLLQISKGSEPAFRQLYNAHHQHIYSFALFLTRSDILAEDITQEIFIKIWTLRNQLAGVGNFNAWIRTVVRNHTYTYVTRLAREQLILKEIAGNSEEGVNQTETDVLDHEYSRLLQQAIEQLAPQQKKVYLLSRQQGLKQEAIAAEMDLSVQTVKNHMKAALRNIKNFISSRTDVLIAIGLALFFPD